ncbi:MAG: universal stress protein [Kofleriaceae bacterium]|nr:universal stress protein [Kofleriaceae bacterium]
MTFTKITCATDFSPGAQVALRVAARLAVQTGAQLEIVHAWALPVIPVDAYAFPANVVDQLVEDARRGLAEAAATVREMGIANATTKLLEGGAGEVITDELERDTTVDLVVVGTHGRTGLPRMLVGSVAERIVRHAPCSVLVVRPASQVATFDHVACLVDFGEGSRYAVELAAALANPAGRGLTLLHVLELPITFNGVFDAPDFVEDLDRRATGHLQDWKENLLAHTKLAVTTQMRIGTPAAQGIAMLDGDPSFDLVCVGSRNRTGLKRMLLGSVAERIVRHAKAPVLVARQRTRG